VKRLRLRCLKFKYLPGLAQPAKPGKHYSYLLALPGFFVALAFFFEAGAEAAE